MKQEAFIQKLQHELKGLPKAAVDDIVADYREYIGDALGAGRQEEEVVAALGDPVKLGRELRAQANYRQWEARRSFGNLARVIGSIAGLGLLHIFLLLPFMLYLMLLTVAYAVSGSLALAGFVAVLGLGSYHAFGWPGMSALPFAVHGGHGHHGTVHPDMRDLRVAGDRFVLALDDGDHVSIVTTSGPVDIRRSGGALTIESPVGAAQGRLTRIDDTSVSIARADVMALDVKQDDGGRLSMARSGRNPDDFVWDVTTAKGAHLSFDPNSDGKPARLSAHGGADSVVIDNSHIFIDDANDHFHLAAPAGSSLTRVAFGYALGMLAGGIIGFALCIWLTRVTWRAVTRYIRRQMERVATRLDRGPAA